MPEKKPVLVSAMAAGMTSSPRADKPADRHPYGPRVVGALLPKVTRAAFKAMPPAVAQLLADWPAIVGPALAASTQPRRFASGTLTLGCTGPVALELQHLAGPLMDRINGHLGRPTVQRLRFLQQPVAASPVPAAMPRPPPARRAIAGLPAGPLHDALADLGAALQARRPDERA